MNFISYLRLFLFPFSGIYWLGFVLKKNSYSSNSLQKLFGLEIYTSKVPVICIGNIRVGGTGKSQLIIRIAECLVQKGKEVAILSRGYKRKSKGFYEVTSDDAEFFGDEPVLIKMNLTNAKVFVSEDRSTALRKLNDEFQFDFILMDDGLQNFSIRKDYSIVLIDKNYFSNKILEKLLLPAGNLRESKKSINKYDCLIINKKFEDFDIVNINHRKKFIARYRLEGFVDFDNQTNSTDKIRTENNGLFCGIAQPESFKILFEKNNIPFSFFKSFPDHHLYDLEDLKILIKFVEKFGCKNLITTEKDFVRLTKFKDEFKRAGVFLYSTKITAVIQNEDELINEILCLKKN